MIDSEPVSNPFEHNSFNMTRAVQMTRREPDRARALFQAAKRRGTLEPCMAVSEKALFPPATPDPYAWLDGIDA
jgi:hypothetical protein